MATLLDALVYHYLTEKGYGEASKSLRTSLGVKKEELLGLVAVSGGDLKTATAAFTRAAAIAAAAAMEDDSDDDSEDEAVAVAARAKASKAAAKKAKALEKETAAAPAAKRKRTASVVSETTSLVGKRKRIASVASEASVGIGAGDDWQPAEGSTLAKPLGSGGQKGGPRIANQPFHRVSVQEVEDQGLIFDKALADNTYAGTYGESGWGAKASAILSKVKGKDFRHEKTKKKRGTYRGGTIDGTTSSFKFAD